MSEPLSPRRLYYFPSRAQKRQTTEAGPPAWHPDKGACPDDMTAAEREELLREIVSAGGDALDPVRFAVRRREGRLEWFTTRLTCEHADGRIEVHGFPFSPGGPKVPPAVLRRLRSAGVITVPEYGKLVKA